MVIGQCRSSMLFPESMRSTFFPEFLSSYARGVEYRMTIAKDALCPSDRVLLIDDFLAMGSALEALRKLAVSTGATVVGAGIAVEKTFQPGGERLRAQGLRIESLARIKSIDPLEFES